MNILKRLAVHAGAANLGLLMRKLFGVGTPKSLQGRLRRAFCRLPGLNERLSSSWRSIWRTCARLYQLFDFKRPIPSLRPHPENGHLHHGLLAWLLALLAAPLVAFLTSLTRPALDADESLYLAAARHMAESGDWLLPVVNGVPFLDKPPWLYWLAAASFRIFGFEVWAGRLPGALAAAFTCWLLSRQGGLRAALVFGFSAGTFLFTLEVMHDIHLLLFLTLAAWFAVRMLTAGEAGWRESAGFGSACAGALLSKGLLGPLFPLGALVVSVAVSGVRLRSSARAMLAGLAAFLAIGLPWHLALEARTPGFLRHYFVNEQILRFLARREPMDFEPQPFWLFLLLIQVWLFPWSVFLPQALAKARELARSRPVVRYAAWWALGTFAFLSLSARLDHYSFLLLPPAAILIGSVPAPSRASWMALAILGVLLLGCGAAGLVWWNLGGAELASADTFERNQANWGDFDPLLRLPAATVASLLWPFLAVTLGSAAALLVGGWAGRRGDSRMAWISIAVAMAVFQAAASWSLQRCSPLLSSVAFAAEVQKADLLLVAGDFESANSLAFYTHTPVRLVGGVAPSLAGGLQRPGVPPITIDDAELRRLWASRNRRVLLLTEPAKWEALRLPPAAPRIRNAGRALYANREP